MQVGEAKVERKEGEEEEEGWMVEVEVEVDVDVDLKNAQPNIVENGDASFQGLGSTRWGRRRSHPVAGC